MIFLSQTTREILLRYAYFEMFLANERQNRIPKLLVESRILFKYWKNPITVADSESYAKKKWQQIKCRSRG